MHLADTLDILYLSRSFNSKKMITAKPVFRIFDRAKTLEFYQDWLGFSIDWEHRFGENSPVYMQVSLNGLCVHLTEHHDDCSPGGRIHIEDFPDLKGFHQLLHQKDYAYAKPGIGPAFWDDAVTVMQVTDPFGNNLVFTENVPFY
jgi:hypothetical protein